MGQGQASQPGMTWLALALVTVAAWGCYGVFLHTGQMAMGDPVNGRYKAFLLVGVAYFLTAVLAPLVFLLMRGASWQMPMKGISWSLIAGIMGAFGAFFALLALGEAKGSPSVMSVIFAGAPIVNALVAIAMHPPEGGLSAVKWPFVLGLFMAAIGGSLVTLYRPQSAPAPRPLHTAVHAPDSSAPVGSTEAKP